MVRLFFLTCARGGHKYRKSLWKRLILKKDRFFLHNLQKIWAFFEVLKCFVPGLAVNTLLFLFFNKKNMYLTIGFCFFYVNSNLFWIHSSPGNEGPCKSCWIDLIYFVANQFGVVALLFQSQISYPPPPTCQRRTLSFTPSTFLGQDVVGIFYPESL